MAVSYMKLWHLLLDKRMTRSDGKPVPDEVIGVAAELCVYYSSACCADKTPVDYTLKKYVKKLPAQNLDS